MQQEILFSLAEMKTQKMNMQESKERKFEEKVIREKGWTVLIFTSKVAAKLSGRS